METNISIKILCNLPLQCSITEFQTMGNVLGNAYTMTNGTGTFKLHLNNMRAKITNISKNFVIDFVYFRRGEQLHFEPKNTINQSIDFFLVQL